MKYVLGLLLLVLIGCGKNQTNCNPNSGQAQYNGNTVNLIDGTCTMTTQSIWQNPTYIEYTICNTDYVTLNGIVCQANVNSITSTTTGCTPMGDGYQVIPNSPTIPTEQCWFNITNGKINDLTPPTF